MSFCHSPISPRPGAAEACFIPAKDAGGCMLAEAPAVYRPRHPERTWFYQLFETHFDSYVRAYEERFEARAGPLRPVVVRSVEAFLDCGRVQGGFASFTAPAPTALEPPFRPPMMATPSLWQTQTGSRTIPIIPGKPGARGRAC
jgi:hypothetical protein